MARSFTAYKTAYTTGVSDVAQYKIIPVTTTGANGSAAGVASLPINGILLRASIIYAAGQPATTDVTIRERLPDNITRTILTVSNNATNLHRALQIATYDATNTATSNYMPEMVAQIVEVDVGGANAAAPAVRVYLLVEGSRD